MSVSAVVDRIVDDTRAVLLVGPEDTEMIVPVDRLPTGIREGTWLRIDVEGCRLIRARIDDEATERTRERIKAKLALLRKRGRPSPKL